MIKLEKIYEATRGGLDIIHDLYPQSRGCEEVKNKKFRIRDEKTPSACLHKVGDVWKVTDFGGEGRAESPIDLYMKETGCARFNEAVLRLAAQYGVTDELDRTLNRPDYEERPAKVDEKDGQRYFEFNEQFTDYELKVLGPNVTQEHVDALHWHSVKSITYVRDRRAKVKRSNDHYPIFARECLVKEAVGDKPEVKFYKLYEPLNYDKGWRFSYWPEGVKPKEYINGLAELRAAYRQYNAAEEEAYNRENPDGSKPYKPQKLPEAFICSGERDSLCCRSLGFNPLWFNSETYRLSLYEYNEIAQLVETVYNIPDIDETGVRKGRELALRFLDIHTIWLPSWLSPDPDNRGKGRKDLRDWMEIRERKQDFKDLMTLAMPAKFWQGYWNSKKQKNEYTIDTACLYNFLQLNGFYILHDDNSSQPQYIRVDGYKVRRHTPREIREFVRKWAMERAVNRDILNLILNSPKLSAAALDSLPETSPDFTNYTPTSQLFFFPNTSVEVTGAGEKEFRQSAAGGKGYVWEENVIAHHYRHLDDMFSIKRTTDDEGKERWDIEVKDTRSKFFSYLINTSRLSWRKEMEARFGENDADERRRYCRENRFRIDGEGLTADEIADQKLCLVNKIFATGYLLHHHKQASRAWAPMAMDNKIGELGECNGRSGKSFFFSTLARFMQSVKLSGRNPRLMDNPHVFDQVTEATDLLLIDDCNQYLNAGLFYDNITGDMTVNPKNNRSYTIPFSKSPKLAFSTNYVPSDFDASTEGRLLYMVFSDYYHQKTEENDYLETRTIHDDFGKDLYSEAYTEDEWNADINFMLQACRFYLSMAGQSVKIQPPMANIIYRKRKADMGANFEDWANAYFAPESGRLDKFLVRETVYEDYRKFSGNQKISPQAINKKLYSFAIICPWIQELNPEEYHNAGNRILRRDPNDTAKTSPVQMIYLKSNKQEAERLRQQAAADAAIDRSGDDALPF